MAFVDFNSAARLSTHSGAAVYTKTTWGSEWTAQPTIHAEQCAWTIAPEVATATLRRPYGRVVLPGGSVSVDLTRAELRGHFVRIDWTTDEAGISSWLGYVEAPVDQQLGSGDGTVPASGNQTFFCYGMERALQVAPIRDTVWRDNTATGTVRGGCPVAFNAWGQPNRSADLVDGTYVFEPEPDEAEYWTSRDIIQYLLAWQLPTNNGDVAVVPWQLSNETVVPNWDSPTVDTEGRTIYAILSELLGSRMLLGWTVSWDSTSLLVHPFSLTPTSVVLEGATFAANTTTHTLAFNLDPLTNATISEDGTDAVDQVICRGARRISICTLDFTRTEIDSDWTTDEAGDYNEAASGDPDYANWDVYKKRKRNAAARQSSLLASVYRRFRIPDDWDAMVDTEDPVFIIDEEEDAPHRPYPQAMRIRQSLGFDPSKDYSGPLTAEPTFNVNRYREPMLTLEDPVGGRREVQTIGRSHDAVQVPGGGEPEWSISVIVDSDRTLLLDVSGGPNHVIAGDDFVPTDADPEIDSGYDYRSLRATVALEEDRYAEAAWPTTLATADVVRRRVVYLGDAYQLIRIVPGTAVALDTISGDEKTSDGGYIRDDRPRLKSMARLLAAYHGSPRKQMTLQTHRRTGQLTVGSLITSVGDSYPTAINALISRIEIHSPETDDRAMSATQTITAATSPIDLMTTLALIRGDYR